MVTKQDLIGAGAALAVTATLALGVGSCVNGTVRNYRQERALEHEINNSLCVAGKINQGAVDALAPLDITFYPTIDEELATKGIRGYVGGDLAKDIALRRIQENTDAFLKKLAKDQSEYKDKRFMLHSRGIPFVAYDLNHDGMFGSYPCVPLTDVKVIK